MLCFIILPLSRLPQRLNNQLHLSGRISAGIGSQSGLLQGGAQSGKPTDPIVKRGQRTARMQVWQVQSRQLAFAVAADKKCGFFSSGYHLLYFLVNVQKILRESKLAAHFFHAKRHCKRR